MSLAAKRRLPAPHFEIESTMEYIVPGICGLLIILGLVAIVMSRTTWRIPQLILMFFLLVASLVFFYFSARVLKLRNNYQVEIEAYQNQLRKYRPLEADVAKNGVPNSEKGIIDKLEIERNQLRLDVAKALAERGRVWDDAGADSWKRLAASMGPFTRALKIRPSASSRKWCCSFSTKPRRKKGASIWASSW